MSTQTATIGSTVCASIGRGQRCRLLRKPYAALMSQSRQSYNADLISITALK